MGYATADQPAAEGTAEYASRASGSSIGDIGLELMSGGRAGRGVAREATQIAKGGVTIGYHATYPEAAASILEGGFRPGSKAGRLGSGGVYVNDSVSGAIDEFSYHNPGVTPTVLKVEYSPGRNATAVTPPQKYVESHPLDADSVSAPSVRAPGTINTNVVNGTARPIGVVEK